MSNGWSHSPKTDPKQVLHADSGSGRFSNHPRDDNKALLGYMLKLYRKETRDDLVLIGEIRNRFAHVAHPMTFADSYVLERCEKLTLFKRAWSMIPGFKFSERPLDGKSARRECQTRLVDRLA